MYSSSILSDKQLTKLINDTSEVEEGSQGKRTVFTSQTIFNPILFPDRKALNMLLKELADLFKYFYDKVEESNKMVLAAPSNALLFLTHLAYRHAEAHTCLQDHKYIITTFDSHLKWPGPPMMQLENDILAFTKLGRGLL